MTSGPCGTCGAANAPGLLAICENVHERICDACVFAWADSPRLDAFGYWAMRYEWAKALAAFRAFQDDRRAESNAAADSLARLELLANGPEMEELS